MSKPGHLSPKDNNLDKKDNLHELPVRRQPEKNSKVFLTTVSTSLIGSILLLKYYYGCRYWFTFVTYTLYCVCSLCYVIVFYTILNFNKLSNYFNPLLFLSVGAGIVYGASLIFLKADNKRWLKIAGAFMVVIELIYRQHGSPGMEICGQDSGRPGSCEFITNPDIRNNDILRILLLTILVKPELSTDQRAGKLV